MPVSAEAFGFERAEEIVLNVSGGSEFHSPSAADELASTTEPDGRVESAAPALDETAEPPPFEAPAHQPAEYEAPMAEPVWSKFKDKYKPVAVATEILPPLGNVVGVTTSNMAAEKGDFIRAVIRARRRAVEFMNKNPDEAGDIVAKHYNLEPAVARAAVRNLTSSRTEGVPYWGTGQIHLQGLKRIIEVQRMVGAIKGEVDFDKIIDTSFLPDDIKGIIR